ncbi:enoyl-CoA hydratase/isomerase family protein [Streptomyces hirsutus]|uniref:enoyl-CoA hydratase/isomerase family protein n=1 Tax=Streptomyces hirsutus TaxID=35620 RepID=UPI00331AEC26
MYNLNGVRYTIEDGVATIMLARPEVSNSIDLATARSFGAVVEAAGADDAVRVILLTGDGPRFCAGGDVAWVASAADPASALLELANELDSALQSLGALPKPVVASVQGAAAGAGLGVVLAADVVVSARSTRYLTAYANVGLTPDCGVSWLLPRAVGQQRALELALTGRVLSADEARDWGLVTTVVEDDELATATAQLATKLAAGAPYALGQARRLIRSSYAVSRANSGADESRTVSAAAETTEAQAAIAQFVK